MKKKKGWSEVVFKCPEASCDFKTAKKYSLTRHCIRWHRGRNKKNWDRKKRYTQEQIADDLKKLLEKPVVLVKQGHKKISDGSKTLPEKPAVAVNPRREKAAQGFKKSIKRPTVLLVKQGPDRATFLEEENEKVFVCRVPQCGLRYKSEKTLQGHERMHDASAVLQCDLCNFQTFRPFSLKRHEETHKKRTKFRCKHCPKKFTRKDDLRAHTRTFHPDPTTISHNAEAIDARNCLPKSVCKNRSRISKGLRLCSFPGCHFRSLYRECFIRHLKLHDKTRAIFKCNICQQKCARKDVLKRHMGRVHSKSKRIEKESCNYFSDNDSRVKNEHEEIIVPESVQAGLKYPTPPPTLLPENKVQSYESYPNPNLPPPVLTPAILPMSKGPLSPSKNNNSRVEAVSKDQQDCDFCNYVQRLPRYLSKHLKSCVKCTMARHGIPNSTVSTSMYENNGCEFVCEICGFVGESDETVMLKHSVKHRKLHVKLVRLES